MLTYERVFATECFLVGPKTVIFNSMQWMPLKVCYCCK